MASRGSVGVAVCPWVGQVTRCKRTNDGRLNTNPERLAQRWEDGGLDGLDKWRGGPAAFLPSRYPGTTIHFPERKCYPLGAEGWKKHQVG